MIAPAGAIITVDALNTQKDTAWEIREQKADYVLALKGNHKNLHDDVKWFFDYANNEEWNGIRHDYARTDEKAHGRVETRECWITSDLGSLDADSVKQWRDLKCIVQVRGSRTVNDITSVEDRYFLTSLPADAKRVMDAVRQHWGIENSLHWILDTSYAEDANKARIKNAQANWAAIRRLCVSIFKQEKTVKAGSNAKRLRAAIDQDYLLKLLQIKTT
jgi:predicted transposase YbfD/YdcC